MRFLLLPRKSSGFALMEPMIAVGLLAIVASSAVYAMMSSNRFAISQRYVSNAKALCQERIDAALATSFPPLTTGTLFGNWTASTPGNLNEYEVLPAENVSIYTMADSGSTTLVQGLRRTWVTRYPDPVTADPAFLYARVRVRVEFLVNGRGPTNKIWTVAADPKYFYEMTTLRAAD